MRRLVVFAFVAGACNPVFDIGPTDLEPDAPPPRDEDADGVPDAQDNCPDIANDQVDEDEDGRGDRCDNCPLVRNPRQELDGDTDAVGTACDPRPELTGDCLVLFDAFSDPASFDQQWRQYASTTTAPPVITPGIGSVVIDGPTGLPATIVAKDDNGVELSGLFDVQVVGRASLTTGTFAAVARASSYRSGYQCGISGFTQPKRVEVSIGVFSETTGGDDNQLLSAEPANGDTLLRLFSPRGSASAEPDVRCRVEHGFAAGIGDKIPSTTNEPPPGGGPGIRVADDVVEVSAIAIYRFQTTPCPPPIMR